MPSELAPSPVIPNPAIKPTTLRRFLDAYWLRPENALWMTLRSEVLQEQRLHHPTIDVSCGDGIFMFLHLGGVFDPSFDVFRSVGRLNHVQSDHADMFDCVNDTYQPIITTSPADNLDVGIDVKPALLAKARRLALYERLVEHDNNQPLPLKDGSFRVVYCNAAYWVHNIDGFLRELARVVRPDGLVILHIKLDSLKRYTLEAHRAVLGNRVLDILGRGRLDCWPSLASRSTWESRFAAAGLTIEVETPFITRTHAHLWDIGLRPIAPMLVRMTQTLTPQTRASIKADWVDLFYDLFSPLLEPNLDLFPGNDEPGEIQYVLRRI